MVANTSEDVVRCSVDVLLCVLSFITLPRYECTHKEQWPVAPSAYLTAPQSHLQNQWYCLRLRDCDVDEQWRWEASRHFHSVPKKCKSGEASFFTNFMEDDAVGHCIRRLHQQYVHPVRPPGLCDPRRTCSVLHVHVVILPASFLEAWFLIGYATHLDPTVRLAVLRRAHEIAWAGERVCANVVVTNAGKDAALPPRESTR